MRSLFLAGAVIVSLGAGTAVQAGPIWHAKDTLRDCITINIIGNVKQFNCDTNVVGNGDWNRQKIEQKNKAILNYEPSDTIQLNAGANVVDNGDGNHQKIEQKNFYKNDNAEGDYNGPIQTNYSLNVVKDGDHNSQSSEQSNTLIVRSPAP